MVFVKCLIIICQRIQRIATPSRDRFSQLIRSMIIRIIIPAFFPIVLVFLYICYIRSLKSKGQTLYRLIIEGHNSRKILLQMIFPAIYINPCGRISIRY